MKVETREECTRIIGSWGTPEGRVYIGNAVNSVGQPCVVVYQGVHRVLIPTWWPDLIADALKEAEEWARA